MKKILILTSLLIILENALFASISDEIAANNMGSSTTHAASATVIRALSLSNESDLSFGSILSTNTSGSITINDNGSSFTGGVGIQVEGSTGSISVTGSSLPGAVFAVLSNPPTELTKIGGDETMPVQLEVLNGGWTYMEEIGSYIAPITLNDGAATIRTGGTLTVGANQAEGHYTASWPITIVYGGF